MSKHQAYNDENFDLAAYGFQHLNTLALNNIDISLRRIADALEARPAEEAAPAVAVRDESARLRDLVRVIREKVAACSTASVYAALAAGGEIPNTERLLAVVRDIKVLLAEHEELCSERTEERCK